MYVYATDPRKPIPIGVQGENDARTVVFDIHSWIEDYGNGSALLVHQRPGDAEPYPVTTVQKAGTIEWTVQQADIIAGAPGRAQLSYQVGDNIVARSPIYTTLAADEITNTPLSDNAPAQSWINDLLEAVNKAGDITSDVQAAQSAAEKAEAAVSQYPKIQSGNWYVYDADTGVYTDTGVSASGPEGPQGNPGPTGAKGDIGPAGPYYIPSIDADGVVSWTNTGGLENPDPVSVRGPQGVPGPTGDTGPAGQAAGFGQATATVGTGSGTPTVTVSTSGPDSAKVFAFAFDGLKGTTGDPGPTGPKGDPGTYVARVERTAGTGAPGTTDVYTMYDSDGGVIGTFTVYNGVNGTGSGDFLADGSVAMTGDLNAGGHRITNVGAPTAAGDAVRQSDLQAVSDEIDAIIAGTTPVNIPVATDVKAGIVKPGEHLSVTADGTLNAEWPDLSGYLTEIPAEYVTSTELAGYGYITSAALNGYATQSWVQEQGYLTAIPAEYVTDSELTSKGYATTADVAETYAEKALKFTGTFTAAGWTSATGGYSQTINVSGLTADDEPVIDLNSTATDADTFNGQLEAFGLVSNFTTGAGTLTAVVLGDSAPEVDIPIHGVVVY